MRYLLKLLLVPKLTLYNSTLAFAICANCDKSSRMTASITTPGTCYITVWQAVNDTMLSVVCDSCMRDFFQLNPVQFTNE